MDVQCPRSLCGLPLASGSRRRARSRRLPVGSQRVLVRSLFAQENSLTHSLTQPDTHSLNRTADVVFSQKLTEELKYEKESGAAEEPEFLKAFREQGVWTVRLSFSASFPYRRLLTDARLAD